MHFAHGHIQRRSHRGSDKNRYGASSSILVGGLSPLSLWHSISLFHSVCSNSLFGVTNVASRIMWRKIKLQLSQQAAWASDECWWIKGTWQRAIHPRPEFWFLLCQTKSVWNNNSFTLSHFAEFCSTICSSKLFRANLDFIITKPYRNNNKKIQLSD